MSADFKLLFLDIETAPHQVYCWGLWDQRIALNQVVRPGYTLCYAAQWQGSREIMFDSVQSGAGKMLRSVYKLLDEADAVAHYNGTSFDVPVLSGEFMEQHWPPPAPFAQIDMIKVARRARMASRKLDYLAQRLGLGSKTKHKGMELWRGCMDGEAAAWKVMERYNKQDVRLLARLYKELLPWIKGHPNLGLGRSGHVCPKCGSTHTQHRGEQRSLTRVYDRWQCRDCGSWSQTTKSRPGGALLKGVA